MLSTIKKAGVLFRRLTATASDVLSGKVFYGVGSKKPQVGTMTNKAGTSTDTTMDVSGSKVRMVVPENGYYDTSSYLTMDGTELGDAAVGDVRRNKTFSSKDGIKLTGTGTNIVSNARVVFVERHASGYGGSVSRTYNNTAPGIAVLYAAAGSNIAITSTGAGTNITPETVWGNDQDNSVRARLVTEAGTVTYNLGINASYGIFIFIYV